MFGLESLTSLRGVKCVDISGLPHRYETCLRICIQGEGGDIKEIDWPLLEVRHRRLKKYAKKRTTMESSRQWFQPMLDWREYAERNQVQLPDDLDDFITST